MCVCICLLPQTHTHTRSGLKAFFIFLLFCPSNKNTKTKRRRDCHVSWPHRHRLQCRRCFLSGLEFGGLYIGRYKHPFLAAQSKCVIFLHNIWCCEREKKRKRVGGGREGGGVRIAGVGKGKRGWGDLRTCAPLPSQPAVPSLSPTRHRERL